MQKVAKYLLLVLACVPPMVVHAQAQTEMDMGKTVGELVRLEAAKALSELRRSAPPPELPPMPATAAKAASPNKPRQAIRMAMPVRAPTRPAIWRSLL